MPGRGWNRGFQTSLDRKRDRRSGSHCALPDIASRFRDRRQNWIGIYDRIQILSGFPESGSMLPEKGVPEWRKLIVRSWKVAYRIEFDAHTVYIARIWHASRDEIELPD